MITIFTQYALAGARMRGSIPSRRFNLKNKKIFVIIIMFIDKCIIKYINLTTQCSHLAWWLGRDQEIDEKVGYCLSREKYRIRMRNARQIRCTGFANGVLVDVAGVHFYKQFAYWREKRLCGNTSHPKLATVRSR